MELLTASSIHRVIEELQLVDHHVHGAYRVDGPEERLQNAMNEANTAPLDNPAYAYDSQLGFAVRRWCAPLLDLPEHAPPDEYWRRRAALGEAEVARRLTRAAGVSDWLVDTGFRASALYDLAGLAAVSGGRTHEIVRLEAVAESVIATLDDPTDYADAFGSAVTARATAAVGVKSVLAYRIGFDIDLTRPTPAEVARAAQRWHEELAGTPAPRLTDPVLLRYGIHLAVDELGLPLQFHVGLGDRDLDLRRTNPLHLLDFLRVHEPSRVPIMLLHCYPFEREAGYLAQAFETIHVDVGLATHFLGARSTGLIARSLELAPFGKILYSSDGFGPAELHHLGAALWRVGMASVLGDWVANGDWSDRDACRVVTMIGRDNARRVYRLP